MCARFVDGPKLEQVDVACELLQSPGTLICVVTQVGPQPSQAASVTSVFGSGVGAKGISTNTDSLFLTGERCPNAGRKGDSLV